MFINHQFNPELKVPFKLNPDKDGVEYIPSGAASYPPNNIFKDNYYVTEELKLNTYFKNAFLEGKDFNYPVFKSTIPHIIDNFVIDKGVVKDVKWFWIKNGDYVGLWPEMLEQE